MRDILSLCLLSAACLWADGHGPAFGYSTTTLGEGDTGVETVMMWRSGVAMLAPLVSYGATENLQFSVSAPFHLNHGDHPVGRFTADMPGNPEAEVLAAWRFHHKLTGVGTRNESTLYLGASESTQLPPRADGPPLSRATGLYIGGATGHISRRYYIWGGAGYQRYNSTGNDHQSNSFLSSLVVGWRPKFWERDYPKPDLRLFWETTGEHIGSAWRRDIASETGPGHHDPSSPLPGADANGIIVLPDSGGSAVYSGPTFLCTYRNIAFQSGVLFAVWRKPNGIQPPETFRAVIGVELFFPRRPQVILPTKRVLSGVALVWLLLTARPACAEYLKIRLKVYGLDCQLCARGVSKSIGRIAGVQSVDVSLKTGVLEITLTPGNTFRMSDLRKRIKENGFRSMEATVTAVGQARGSKFEIAGIPESYDLGTRTPTTANPVELTFEVR